MNCTAVGVDIAKNVFQVHYVDQATGEIVNKPIKRAQFLEHFANRTPCLIGMEACGGAHHWARQLVKMGPEVRLIPAEFAKASNIRKKNDAADARAIWLAVQQPGKPVALKTETQQAMLALHRMRQQLIKFRTMQINNLRGLLTEYGEVMGQSRAALDKAIPEVLGRVPAFDELRRVALHPTQDRRVGQRQAAFGHDLDKIAQTELVAQIPAYAKDDDFAVEMTAVEQPLQIFQLAHWLVIVKSSRLTDRRFGIAPQPHSQPSQVPFSRATIQIHAQGDQT
ncbi:hypothetical protein LMG28688_07166 [Paraburkholderia caffeinitolerans]|uniref:Transposase IS110-like N-terminal domain-containing protein n=1 Tax=Paraburkholderia caffeinitolerans TaxID=1723730 RepID=A0A6J5H431_9BURK|nr:hypothetical protein LMG28688_07166 [Paraburkholderia caffeinitolerans]